jgi:hypothetical protein
VLLEKKNPNMLYSHVLFLSFPRKHAYRVAENIAGEEVQQAKGEQIHIQWQVRIAS